MTLAIFPERYLRRARRTLPAACAVLGSFRQADIARAIKAMQKAKLPIASMRIEPDGSIVIIQGAPQIVAPAAANTAWDD